MLIGGSGDDVLTGGPGVDSLTGDGDPGAFQAFLSGNDRINARDGEAESVNCGLGADTAVIDATDTLPTDPQTACEVVDSPGAAPPAPSPAATPVAKPPVSISSSRLRYRKRRIAVALRCAAQSGTCRGRLEVKTAKRVRARGSRKRRILTVAQAKYAIPAKRTRTIRLKPSSAGRSLLRRVSRVRVLVQAKPRGGGTTVSRSVTLR